jgi:hypothetical protein
MLLKLLQTQWESKEKMIQHIIVIATLLTPYEKNLIKGKNLTEFKEQYICRVYFPKNLGGENRKYDM